MTAHNPAPSASRTDPRFEHLLDGFEPSFEFERVGPLPESEFVDRLRRIRREATVAGFDVILIHADSIGSYKVSNSYLRYVCDWAREGVLVVPTDDDRPLTMEAWPTASCGCLIEISPNPSLSPFEAAEQRD